MSIEVMTRVWKLSRQQGTALLALLALADWANDDGIAWPAMKTLAEKARLDSERQAQRVVHHLEVAGELFVVRRGGRGKYSLYQVCTGMNAQWLSQVLMGEKFKLGADEASRIASDVIARQEKVTSMTPKEKGPKGDISGHEKVTSADEKGDILRKTKAGSPSADAASGDPIRHRSVIDPSGNTNTDTNTEDSAPDGAGAPGEIKIAGADPPVADPLPLFAPDAHHKDRFFAVMNSLKIGIGKPTFDTWLAGGRLISVRPGDLDSQSLRRLGLYPVQGEGQGEERETWIIALKTEYAQVWATKYMRAGFEKAVSKCRLGPKDGPVACQFVSEEREDD